jgi:hypothetical protein
MMIPSEISPIKKTSKREEAIPSSSFKKILSKKRNEESNPTPLPPYTSCFYDTIAPKPENKEASKISGVHSSVEKYSTYLDELADEISMNLSLQDEISTLKTTYQKEGSPFNHLEIFIDHYSTAPSSFNIELYAQGAGADILGKNYPQLIERLASIMPGHQFNISPPFIRSETFNNRHPREKKRESVLKKSLKI